MTNEPIDLRYESWFPTDGVSSNLRHVVPVIFSHRRPNMPGQAGHQGQGQDSYGDMNTVAQSMEVDQVSDGNA